MSFLDFKTTILNERIKDIQQQMTDDMLKHVLELKKRQENMNYLNEYYPSNIEYLKNIFPIQDEQNRNVEPHSKDFELELKKFFAFGRRRTGRTTMLARVLVETAIETERPIRIIDHYIDERVGRDNIHHTMMQIDRIINEYRHKGCPISVRKFDRHNGIISLFVQPEFLGEYEKLRIENNPTKFEVFPTEDLKKQLEKVKQQKKLLLIRKRRLS